MRGADQSGSLDVRAAALCRTHAQRARGRYAQSEMSTRAARTLLIQLRLYVYFIMPPFLELGSIRSILINVAVFESRHGKQHTFNRKN